MQVSNFVLDAVNAAIDFDIPEEAYPEAVNAQACLMSGQDADDVYGYDVDRTVH
jgi:hypothetical protein